MIKNFKELRERVKSSRPLVVSVAAAADTELLLAVKAAVDDGFIQPVLTGDKEKIEELIAKRAEAKKAKDFAAADAIRDELAAMGITIKDTRQGVQWFRG